jgi:hypothetical protein
VTKLLLIGFIFFSVLSAEGQTVAPVCKVRICSQNLHNFASLAEASRRSNLTKLDWLSQRVALIKRLIRSRCDVVAFQELLNKDRSSTIAELFRLIVALKILTRQNHRFEFSTSQDPALGLGFLYRSDLFRRIQAEDLSGLELPKLHAQAKPVRASRGPLRIILESKCYRPLQFDLFNIHLKSKSPKSGYDASGHAFEIQRMLQAAGIHKLVVNQTKDVLAGMPTLRAILGDRNSTPDSASAKLLEGRLDMDDFKTGKCPVSKSGFPYCADTAIPRFISVFGGLDGRYPRWGSFEYKGAASWIDDILIDRESPLVPWHRYMTINSGLVKAYSPASDHALVYADILW